MKLGIALAGGGIRGVAHAGVLKALEENKIKVDIIGGTSSGSLVASLYAMGYSPYYIYILFKRYAKELVEIGSTPIISGVGNFMINKKVAISGLKTGESIEEAYNQIALRKGIKERAFLETMKYIDIVNEIDDLYMRLKRERDMDEDEVRFVRQRLSYLESIKEDVQYKEFLGKFGIRPNVYYK